MNQPEPQIKGDPFFEQLRADVLEGIAALDRGEGISIEQVQAHLEQTIIDIQRTEF
jgi:hypothetical protein